MDSSSLLSHLDSAVTNSPILARILPPENTMAQTGIVSLRVIPTSGADRYIAPPTPNLNTHPLTASGPVITEIQDDKDIDDVEISIDNYTDNNNRSINRNSSTISDRPTQLQRQFSFGSKSTDSPSLPKRNQPITSSAPSTLIKKSLEENEVYV